MSPASDRSMPPLLRALPIVAFVLALSLPAVGMILGKTPDPSLRENRRLAPSPPVELLRESPRRYFGQLKKYIPDHFGFRSTLVGLHSELMLRVLHASPSSDVVLGRDGWLYYAGEQILDDYRCVRPFRAEELDQWTGMLERRSAWLRERGIRYMVVVAPNTHTIYPEHLPTYVKRVRSESRLDQLAGRLRGHANVDLLDLRPDLLAAKRMARVYQRTDTHWNDLGAYAAYARILNELNRWFPQAGPLPRSRFEERTRWTPGGDLAGLVGSRSLREEQLDLVPLTPRRARFTTWEPKLYASFKVRPDAVQDSQVDDPSLPRGVIFHDSFANALMPFLSEHFSRLVYVHDPLGFAPALIDAEKPDFVLQEVTERFLMLDLKEARSQDP